MSNTSFFVAIVLAIVCGVISPTRAVQPLLDRTNVIIVPNGTHVSEDNIQDLLNQKCVGFFNNTIPKTNTQKQILGSNSINARNVGSYTRFVANWYVPSITSSGIVFIYSSLYDSTLLKALQPVLQLNNGVTGWQVACWLLFEGVWYEGTPVTVYPGQYVLGVISLSAGGGVWTIEMHVNGKLATSLSLMASMIGTIAEADLTVDTYSYSCASSPGSVVAMNITLQPGPTCPDWSFEAGLCSPSAFVAYGCGYVDFSW